MRHQGQRVVPKRALIALLVSWWVFRPVIAGAIDPAFTVIKSSAGAVVIWNEAPAHFIKSSAGAVVIWNEAPAHFTVELPGSSFVPAKLPGASFVVDGRIIQVFTVRIDHFADPSTCVGRPLPCYKDWEVAYRRSKLAQSVAARELSSSAPGFLTWEIDMPTEITGMSDTSVSKQVYATRVVEQVVFVLSYSATRAENAGSAQAYLASTAKSLKLYTEPIDVETVQRALASH